MSTAVIVLTLDEIDGVNIIMPQVKKEWAEEIVFVDGGSTDGTIERAIRKMREDKRLIMVKYNDNKKATATVNRPPPMDPSQVFLGEIVAANFLVPMDRPTK